MVCRSLDKKDLKTFRLVCKAFEGAAVQFLFDEIFLTSSYSNIKKAKFIAARFGLHVRTLVLSFRDYPEYSSTQFRSLYWTKSQEDLLLPELLDEHYEHAFELYHELRSENLEVLESGGFFESLCDLLNILPRVRRITLTAGGCIEWFDSTKLEPLDPWKSGELCPFDTCELSEVEHITLHCRPHTGYYAHRSRAWKLVVKAISSTRATITEILTPSRNMNHSLIPITAFLLTTQEFQHLSHCFNNLTMLNLSLTKTTTYKWPEDYSGPLEYDYPIAQALSTATNLQHLSIECDYTDEDKPRIDRTRFSSILLNCRFPKLKSMISVYMDATEEEMLCFLEAPPLLTSLFLFKFWLKRGLWPSALTTMRNTLAQIKEVEIVDLDGRPDFVDETYSYYINHEAFQNFLFLDGKNPLTEEAADPLLLDEANSSNKMPPGYNKLLDYYQTQIRRFH